MATVFKLMIAIAIIFAALTWPYLINKWILESPAMKIAVIKAERFMPFNRCDKRQAVCMAINIIQARLRSTISFFSRSEWAYDIPVLERPPHVLRKSESICTCLRQKKSKSYKAEHVHMYHKLKLPGKCI